MSEQILLVDREVNRCRLLQRKLERLGLTVSTAQSLAQVADACELPPRALLIDLSMLCGSERGQIEAVVGQLLGTTIHRCASCGRTVREITPGAGELRCCGRPMERHEPTGEVSSIREEAESC